MSDSSFNLEFSNAARAYELATKRVEALAEARLKDAQAGLIDEQTLNQRLNNICKSISIKEFKSALERYHLKRDDRARKVANLSDHATNINHYKLGHRISDYVRQKCWAAYKVFVAMAPSSIIITWAASQYVPRDEDENWVGRTISGKTVPLKTPNTVSNVAQLLDWQYENHTTVVVKFASKPHLDSMGALALLSEALALQVAKHEKDIEDIKAGTYDLWKPQDIIRLDDDHTA